MWKRQKLPVETPTIEKHSSAFQAGWPRKGTQVRFHYAWNLITAELCLQDVANLQAACSGFEGRVRFLVAESGRLDQADRSCVR